MRRYAKVKTALRTFASQLFKVACSIPMSFRLIFLHDWRDKSLVVEDAESMSRKLHAVYFVLDSEADLLHMAIQALLGVAPQIATIHIVMDKDRMLTVDQQKQMSQLFPHIYFIRSRFRMGWGGPGFILSKIAALRTILRYMSRDDYLVSLDPDVLFNNGFVFREALGIQADTFGHRVQPPQNRGANQYMQGGCYFLSKKAVRKSISKNLLVPMWRVGYFTRLWLPNCPEDFLFSELTKNLSRIYGDFMSLVPEEDDTKSVLHFTEGNKHQRMLSYLNSNKARTNLTVRKSIPHCQA